MCPVTAALYASTHEEHILIGLALLIEQSMKSAQAIAKSCSKFTHSPSSFKISLLKHESFSGYNLNKKPRLISSLIQYKNNEIIRPLVNTYILCPLITSTVNINNKLIV